MLKIINLREISETLQDGYTVLVITRYPGKFKDYIDKTNGVYHCPDLAPSPELMSLVQAAKKGGYWNQEYFNREYRDRFLKEIAESQNAKNVLNKIYLQAMNGRNIALACFCGNEEMCHRSIVAGLLQGYGVPFIGNDYSFYLLRYRMILNNIH